MAGYKWELDLSLLEWEFANKQREEDRMILLVMD